MGEAGSKKSDAKGNPIRKSKSRTGTSGEFSTKLVNNINQLEQDLKQPKQVMVLKEKERALPSQVKLCEHLGGIPLWKQVSLQEEKHRDVDLFALLSSLGNSKVLISTHKIIHFRDFTQFDSRGSIVQPTAVEYDLPEELEETYKTIDTVYPKLNNSKFYFAEGNYRLIPQASILTGDGPTTDAADLIEYRDQELRTTSLPCVLYLIATSPGLLAKLLCGADGLKDYSSSKKQVLAFDPKDQSLQQLSVTNKFLANQKSGKTFFFHLRDKAYWPLYLEKASQYFESDIDLLAYRRPGHYFHIFTGCSVANYQISRFSPKKTADKESSMLKTIGESIKKGRLVAGKIRTWSNRNLWYRDS